MANILLIDDDELLRDTICQMLELDGHRVTEAADGERLAIGDHTVECCSSARVELIHGVLRIFLLLR